MERTWGASKNREKGVRGEGEGKKGYLPTLTKAAKTEVNIYTYFEGNITQLSRDQSYLRSIIS